MGEKQEEVVVQERTSEWVAVPGSLIFFPHFNVLFRSNDDDDDQDPDVKKLRAGLTSLSD